MRLTVTNILNDFENQKKNMMRKYCPIIKMNCNSGCYNYYSAKIHVVYRFGPIGSKTLLTNDIKKIQNDLKHIKVEDMKDYRFIPEGCQYFDAFIEWGGQIPEINYG